MYPNTYFGLTSNQYDRHFDKVAKHEPRSYDVGDCNTAHGYVRVYGQCQKVPMFGNPCHTDDDCERPNHLRGAESNRPVCDRAKKACHIGSDLGGFCLSNSECMLGALVSDVTVCIGNDETVGRGYPRICNLYTHSCVCNSYVTDQECKDAAPLTVECVEYIEPAGCIISREFGRRVTAVEDDINSTGTMK
ncbi:PREDICTED: uncharacterized protein LOC106820960 [Priapulus caudatus]|uniref:Uncharacterized protein LOC106820960 n=1 Tax=Priapulus caudatus TaxID=37621 RepID=A0ABM1F9E7_PRICU|nr:PREDICTED: uncharacterized protein LOC106820960 [Priapulus caudatus]